MFERLSDEEIFKIIYGIDLDTYKSRLSSEDAQLISSYINQEDSQSITQAQLKKTLQDVIEWIENHADIDTWRKRSCFIIFPEHLQELKDQVERMK